CSFAGSTPPKAGEQDMSQRARDLLRELKLERRTALLPALQEQVWIRAMPAALSELPVGASRFGGPPDLPDGVEWPVGPGDQPIPFVFQLDLSDIAGSAAAERLPGGMLAFFVSHNTPARGTPFDRIQAPVACAVLHAA